MKTNALNGFTFTIFGLIVTLTVILIIIWWYYIKWNNRHINILASKLTGPKSYPIVGVGHHFIGTPQRILEKMLEFIKDYAPEPFKVWCGPYFAVVITQPEDVQIVLNNSMALQKDWFYEFFKNMVGEGLGTAPVDKWQLHRRLISPAFNTSHLIQLIPVFNEKTQILISNLSREIGKTQQFDLFHYISSTALDIICQTTMGYNLGTESNSEYKLFIDDLLKALELNSMRLYKPWLFPKLLFSIYLRFIGQSNIFEKLKTLPNRVIKESKAKYKKRKMINQVDTKNTEERKKGFKLFMDVLLELNEVDENFSDDDIRHEVMTMMIAGGETNAVTECFCLLLLAIHSDIQDKVYDEIYEVFGDEDRAVTFEDTNKLVYLEQVIKETLRLYPTAPALVRKLQGDIKIFSGNYILPKGIKCIIAPISTHHMPELYPNPWSFNPDNFNPDNVAKRHKYSFIPFSGGPRGCIGHKYAMLSMKVLISTFLLNFSVHTDLKLSDIKLRIDVVLRSVHGYPVTIRPRRRISTNKSF